MVNIKEFLFNKYEENIKNKHMQILYYLLT